MTIVRRSDDVPVGSINWETHNGQSAYTTVHPDPLLAPDPGGDRRRSVGLLTPYILHEQEFTSLLVSIPGRRHDRLPGCPGSRFRRDRHVARGAPDQGTTPRSTLVRGPAPRWARDVRRSAARRYGIPRSDRGPAGRVRRPAAATALDRRAPARADAGGRACDHPGSRRADLHPPAGPNRRRRHGRWSRKETETFFDNGRSVGSDISTKYIRDLVEDNFPTNLRFAIVARDGDVLIGANGIDDIIGSTAPPRQQSWFHRAGLPGQRLRHRGQAPAPEFRLRAPGSARGPLVRGSRTAALPPPCGSRATATPASSTGMASRTPSQPTS